MQPQTTRLKVTINRTRMAMDGINYAYDGLVSTDQIDRSQHSSFVISGGREYVRFEDATRSAELNAMPLGWDRYGAVVAHEKTAKLQLLELAKSVYPELRPATRWPGLWITVATPDESHATRIVEFHAADQILKAGV